MLTTIYLPLTRSPLHFRTAADWSCSCRLTTYRIDLTAHNSLTGRSRRCGRSRRRRLPPYHTRPTRMSYGAAASLTGHSEQLVPNMGPHRCTSDWCGSKHRYRRPTRRCSTPSRPIRRTGRRCRPYKDAHMRKRYSWHADEHMSVESNAVAALAGSPIPRRRLTMQAGGAHCAGQDPSLKEQ